MRMLLVSFAVVLLASCGVPVPTKSAVRAPAPLPDTPLADGLRLAEGQNRAVEQRGDRYWAKAYLEVTKSPEELLAQDARERRHGETLPKLLRGPRERPEIALTFDDGPHPAFTPQILALLKAERVPATFFVVGKQVERFPGLARAIAAGGNEIGDHTFSHVTLTKIPVPDVAAEYRAAADVIARVTGKRPLFCRPPGGDYDADVIRAATAQGMTTALWTDDPGDYASPAADVLLRRTIGKLENGAIILLHDGPNATIPVLRTLIETARTRGFRFVTLSELTRPTVLAPLIGRSVR